MKYKRRRLDRFAYYFSLILKDFLFNAFITFLFMWGASFIVIFLFAENNSLSFLELLFASFLFPIAFIISKTFSNYTREIREYIRLGLTAEFEEDNQTINILIEPENSLFPNEKNIYTPEDIMGLTEDRYFIKIEFERNNKTNRIYIPKILIINNDKLKNHIIASKI